MPVTEELITEAMEALGVEAVRPLRDGGQKSVRLVKKGDDELVMKVVAVGSSSPDSLARAQREVELLRSVDHPNVVHAASGLVELRDPIEGAAWLEEYLEGTDLEDSFTDQWGWDDTAKMGLDVANGLSALHEKEVVHRDLSANNVRRRDDGSYVVMDPGFARHILKSGLTVGGQPGTAGFFTPEHLQSYSGVPTAASDVFGVGILMFIALTGQFPVPMLGDDADYLRRLELGETQDIDVLCPELSDEQRAIIKKALHPQSARRYRNAPKLAEAIQALQ